MAETSTAAATASPPEPIPVVRADYLPVLLVPVLAAAAYPLIGNPTTWVTLTIAALAMGMMIFVIASGLTLVFGLMDVLNFGHGAFIAVGAYLAMTTLIPLAGWMQADSLALNLAALGLAILAAMVGTGILGWAFERVIIMPVYGQHLKQILITTGGLIVAEQLIHVFWGGDQKPMPLPTALRGAITIGDVAIEKFRLLALAVGLVVFLAMLLVLNRTKLGLLIRAFQELERDETTILLVEQNFRFAEALGDWAVVMDDGRIVHRESMAELARDTATQARLLGLSLEAHG